MLKPRPDALALCKRKDHFLNNTHIIIKEVFSDDSIQAMWTAHPWTGLLEILAKDEYQVVPYSDFHNWEPSIGNKVKIRDRYIAGGSCGQIIDIHYKNQRPYYEIEILDGHHKDECLSFLRTQITYNEETIIYNFSDNYKDMEL